MRVLIDINHPAHVHLFRNFATEMEEAGDSVLFTTRKKDVAVDLLEQYGLDHICFGKHYKKLWGKLWGIIKFDLKLLRVARKFKPDLFLSMGGIYASHVSMLTGKPAIALDDTEHMKDHHLFYIPFTNVCLNPSCFHKSFGKKQVFYHGYHELAYLHPNRYRPDPGIISELGLNDNEKYIILRFVSWSASHDLGQKGMSLGFKREIVRELEKEYRVFISSEGELPDDLKKYRLEIKANRMHDVLAHAFLFIGEGSTMASECACLGTPAIYINSLEVGYCTEQEEYGLVYNFRTTDGLKSLLTELLSKTNLKDETREARARMLKSKIDVSSFLVWFVKNYPGSIEKMKEDPDFDLRFR